MRIVSGSHKGRRIDPEYSGKKLGIRPTTDFAKESLFNILANNFDFTELKILDLFSGSGAISFEFASRGAKEITAVEKDYTRIEFIKSKSKEFGFENIRAIKTDAFRFLDSHSGNYDIIFADPPYELKGIEKIHTLVFQKKILNSGGWLVIEHSSEYDFSTTEHFLEKRTYSAVNFSIFKSKEQNHE